MDNQLPKKIPCSVGILTYNSGKTLRRALEAVKNFSQIIICDGGSTDDTLEIAREYECEVIFQDEQFKRKDGKIKDFSGVRNQMLSAATEDWFFFIDSDEDLTSGAQREFMKICGPEKYKFLVYEIGNVCILPDRIIEKASAVPGYQIRLVHKSTEPVFVKKVHEKLIFNNNYPVGRLKTKRKVFIDVSQEEKRQFKQKTDYYLSIEAKRYENLSPHVFLKSVFKKSLSSFKRTLKVLWFLIILPRSKRMPITLEIRSILYEYRVLYVMLKSIIR